MSRKIIGVTVGTTLPKPDFEQTDSSKGDYIKNKPDLKYLIGDTPVSEQISKALKGVQAQIDDILYKPITISSFAISGLTTTGTGGTFTKSPVELGTTVTSVTLSWVTSKEPTKLILENETIYEKQDDIDKAETSYTYNNLNLTSNKVYTLKATDERIDKGEGSPASKDTTLTFCNRVCYGAAKAPTTIDSDFVMGLKTKTLSNSRTNSGVKYNASKDEYLWYCVPTRLDPCTFTDVETGLGAGLALVATIDVTNASGYTEPYYVYKSDYAGLGSLTVKVS